MFFCLILLLCVFVVLFVVVVFVVGVFVVYVDEMVICYNCLFEWVDWVV